MKFFSLLSGLVAFSLPVVAMAAPGPRTAGGQLPDDVAKCRQACRQAKVINDLNASNSKIWRAGTVSSYLWNSGADSWELYYTEVYTYYPDGKVKTISNHEEFVEYVYDDNGRLCHKSIYQKDGDNMTLVTETTYQYDSVVENLVVLLEEKDYVTNRSYSHGLDVSRNEAGNITEVEEYYITDGQKIPWGTRLTISYGKDGKANAISEDYVYDSVENGTRLTDIVWQNTDGQIYDIDFDDPDSPLYFGANRIKSATIIDSEWPRPATLSVTYDTDGVGFESSLDMDVEKLLSIDYTPIDEFGSYESKCFEVNYDQSPEGDYYVESSWDMQSTYRVDRFGLVLEDTTSYVYHESDGDEVDFMGEKGLVTYDEVNGYPLEYVNLYKYDGTTEYMNQYREVYSDYAAFNDAGVGVVEADNDAPVEYYNLHGIRVSNPGSGLYIRRQGSNVSKIILR